MHTFHNFLCPNHTHNVKYSG
uniref:Uncharacterized protein n=1 Tax=Heterorhabditis bacteriophora TaxID=37862 RepID=A0A1I7WR30_HETBA